VSDRGRTRTERAYRAFKQQVIALADSRDERYTERSEIDAVMRNGSMVCAVWRSASELDGVGVLVIKGKSYLRSIIMDNDPLPPDSCVIECQSYADARCLRVGGNCDATEELQRGFRRTA
jgi:hypothetical protein